MVKYLLIFFLFFTYFFPIELTAGTSDTTAKRQQSDTTDVLSAFTARIKDSSIFINWKLSNPTDIAYFDIERQDPKSRTFEKINDKRIKKSDFIEKANDDNNGIIYKYNFEDKPERDGVYFYHITGYSTNGTILFQSEDIKIGISGIRDFKLEQNHPNPFNPVTTIKYELLSSSRVTLKVYDLIGREVTTLVDDNQSEGVYTVDFDASKFTQLTSGIYFYKLETEKYSDVKKMILSK
ncbi:MAG: T9SS C-terminal target domain-containing protein [Ignavibacteriae bacterium]|nr:MAG: T9SS C-terminal target domain-containing protein [Ignavibacteriota bacterium]